MSVKKKAASSRQKPEAPVENEPKIAHTAAYESALRDYGSAIDLIRRSEYAQARDVLSKIEAEHRDEPELAERARTYARICERRLAPPPARPEGVDDCYARAVFLSNRGDTEEAIELLNQALKIEPNSIPCLYARASAWALKGRADRAVADLRQAIASDPTVRFQAGNDTDFATIREEPAFIDIIEPSTTGA